MRRLLHHLLTSTAIVACFVPFSWPALPADATDTAISVLDLGGSIGKLVWTQVKYDNAITQAGANRYQLVALQVKNQIEVGRAASEVVKGTLGVVGTTLTYAAVVDPEPLSKGIAGVAAWGAKKAGDALGQMVIDDTRDRARSILAGLLKNSGMTDNELKSMKPTELREKVADLKLGGATMRDVLKGDPESLAMLQANAMDIASDIGVEAIARSAQAEEDVKVVRSDLAKMRNGIDSYQKNVRSHLDDVTEKLSNLQNATELAAKSLSDLSAAVGANSSAIRTLSAVSYSGWTTAQKLQAVRGGLFPDLSPAEKSALIKSLAADQAQEKLVSDVKLAAQDLGNLAAIAKNVGLPADAVKGLQGAQIVATGVAQFATGNYLGAVASLTSFAGLGAPDAAAERQAAMMQYLQQQFAVINQKLDKIIDLQVQTLKALEVLNEQQQRFRGEVLGQLDRIEDAVLRNEQLLQAIVFAQWSDCKTIINGTVLNGQYKIPTKEALIQILSYPNIGKILYECEYGKDELMSLLDNHVKPADWSGTIISDQNFPTTYIPKDPSDRKSWNAFEFQNSNAFNTARDFVETKLKDAPKLPAKYLARFAQPAVDIEHSKNLATILERADAVRRFDNFQCNQEDVLSKPIAQLLCYGLAEGTAAPPRTNRWHDLLNAVLIGPHGMTVIDTGIAVAKLANFGKLDPGVAFRMVDKKDIESLPQKGLSDDLRASLGERKDIKLLEKIRWLAEATALQQSIAFGDYTAELIEQTLYDPKTRALVTEPTRLTGEQILEEAMKGAPRAASANAGETIDLDAMKVVQGAIAVAFATEQIKAIEAMKANPILARNVAMLAMRHAIADSLGGSGVADAHRYRMTYYNLGLSDFKVPASCSTDPNDTGALTAKQKLNDLFPNWTFKYVVTATQAADPQQVQLKNCPQEFAPTGDKPLPSRGAGVAVALGKDFYVLAPTPMQLTAGSYELNDSLRLALAYRDRVSQSIIDQNLGTTVRDVMSQQGAAADLGSVALGILDEGWGWHARKKAE
jgi:hypothetical protein